MRFLLLALIFITCSILIAHAGSNGWSCMECDFKKCRSVEELKCKGGLTNGICECCKRCAKQEGDFCEGFLNIYGLCDEGLECVSESDTSKDDPGKCKKKDGSLTKN